MLLREGGPGKSALTWVLPRTGNQFSHLDPKISSLSCAGGFTSCKGHSVTQLSNVKTNIPQMFSHLTSSLSSRVLLFANLELICTDELLTPQRGRVAKNSGEQSLPGLRHQALVSCATATPHLTFIWELILKTQSPDAHLIWESRRKMRIVLFLTVAGHNWCHN